ncbi:putative DNA-binding domain-containing protein [uncultured Shewanella sp.]|uniref:HvfC family RiPP maturation protein n=1 Tax=uncultured Shewanella sp. TaxID=173975 RepID=UPI0026325EF0|nr:putative DNA-binding domain-containing protein [uncultured Shewanella sp.]
MNFIDTQQSFMDYIRDPSRPLPDGMTLERMTVYRELFFNNINGFVSGAFPVLKSLYTDEAWLKLIQQFFVSFDCKTPIFIEISQEFIAFLQTQYQTVDYDPPFMIELAHYEWLELYIATVFDNEKELSITAEMLTELPLSLSVKATVTQYHYDVQHISVNYQPTEPSEQPYSFCVYRDEADEVIFLQLNPLTAQVLGFICQSQACYLSDIIVWLQTSYPQMSAETLSNGCLQMLQQLAEKGIICTLADAQQNNSKHTVI